LREKDTWKDEVTIAGKTAKQTYTVGKGVDVTVAAGRFGAVPVTCETQVNNWTVTATSWYAPRVGLVKEMTRYKVKDRDVETGREREKYELPPCADERAGFHPVAAARPVRRLPAARRRARAGRGVGRPVYVRDADGRRVVRRVPGGGGARGCAVRDRLALL